jgi:hypothetical protein
MLTANIYAAWTGILLGCLAGAAEGLFFHKEDWLGSYISWRRRILRLGHISFFGLGLINLAFVFTARALGIEEKVHTPSILLIIGLVGMPVLCYLSAIKSVFRHLFFIPTISIIIGIADFLFKVITR